MDIESRFGAALYAMKRNKRVRWMSLVVSKQYRILAIKRGCWDERIRNAEWKPDELSIAKMDATLAQTWGYRESALLDKTEAVYEEKRSGWRVEAGMGPQQSSR